MTMNDETRIQLRHEALRMAIDFQKSTGDGAPADQIVADARVFETYLLSAGDDDRTQS